MADIKYTPLSGENVEMLMHHAFALLPSCGFDFNAAVSAAAEQRHLLSAACTGSGMHLFTKDNGDAVYLAVDGTQWRWGVQPEGE